MIKIKKRDVFLVLISSGVYNISSVAFTFFLMKIVDSIISGNYQEFKSNTIFSLVVILMQIVFFAFYNMVKGQVTQKQMSDIRTNMVRGILGFDISYFHKSEVEEYVSFFYNDIGFLKEKYIYRIYDILENAGMFFLALFGIVWIYPLYFIVVLLVVAMAIFLPALFGKQAAGYMSLISNSSQKLMLWLQNILKGFDVIKFYKIEERIADEGKGIITDFECAEYKFDLFMNFVQVGLNFIITILTLLTYVLGGYLVIKKQITLGALVALAQLLFKVASPIMNISSAVTDINSTNDIRKKLKEIDGYRKNKKRKLVCSEFENVINMENVKFAYPQQNKMVLNNISYSFKKGKKYAIIGENGCGKSTLVKLLVGYSDEYKGSIRLYGNELKELEDEEIYKSISYISQESFVFNRSIRENIFISESANMEEEKAKCLIKKLHFQTVLENHPEGMEYVIGTTENLSGGEIQKISIMRALMKNGSVLLIDEGDSNLDQSSREDLYELIGEYDFDLVIVITHHLEDKDMKFFDEIVSMKDGEIQK
jgi:ATP-binding cassette subfamily C protein